MTGNSTERTALGVVVGMVLAIIISGVVGAVGHILYPLPASMDLTDPADVRMMITVMSPSAKSVVLGSWFLGAFIGGWAAMAIARWRAAPWIVALTIVAGAVWSMIMVPHPLWMMVAGVALPLLAAALIAGRASRT